MFIFAILDFFSNSIKGLFINYESSLWIYSMANREFIRNYVENALDVRWNFA
jgi:hypothetical protein